MSRADHLAKGPLILSLLLLLGAGQQVMGQRKEPRKLFRVDDGTFMDVSLHSIRFTGEMEAGKTYRAVVVYRAGVRMWWPVGLLIPKHHAVNVSWNNIGSYPFVKKRQVEGRRLMFTYTVLSKEIWKVPGRAQWRTSYECHITRVAALRATNKNA